MKRMIKVPIIMLSTLLLCVSLMPMGSSSLSIGYYDYTSCPNAESIVRGAVADMLQKDPGLGAGLIRMAFHDCFVEGCDGSILLDSTPGNVAEKDNIANNPSLRGFDVIDEAKRRLNNTPGCETVVSCADIVAFAARDSAAILGNIKYAIPSGRRDGTISRSDQVLLFLPAPFHNVTTVTALFAAKNLTQEDMVILSGSHSIGRSHCSSFSSRLNPLDPTLNATLAQTLKSTCNVSGTDPVAPLDPVTIGVLDNQYYINVKEHNVLFTSDQTLLNNDSTRKYVFANAKKPKTWKLNFAKAMVKMGYIGVKTGSQGEIRRNCRVVN